jgi:hypothetical protein
MTVIVELVLMSANSFSIFLVDVVQTLMCFDTYSSVSVWNTKLYGHRPIMMP